MKTFIKSFFTLLIIALFTQLNVAYGDNNQNNQTEYLFIQTALHGKLTYDVKSLSYKLQLNKVDPEATYFSIAPAHDGGFIETTQLTKLIKQEITTRYPNGINAGLTMFENGKAKATHYSVTLKNPIYNAAERTIIYDASIITGNKVKPLFTNLRFKKAALFIDDMSNGAGGAGF